MNSQNKQVFNTGNNSESGSASSTQVHGKTHHKNHNITFDIIFWVSDMLIAERVVNFAN